MTGAAQWSDNRSHRSRYATGCQRAWLRFRFSWVRRHARWTEHGALAQLNAAGMNPTKRARLLGIMANLSAMGISPKAQLLATQLLQAGLDNRVSQASVVAVKSVKSDSVLAVLGSAVRVGPEAVQQAQRQRESGLSSAAGSIGGAKKDEEDFDPAALNDVATWLRSLRHKYTPNFEGMF